MDPQIVVGLIVDRAGFSLGIGCWEANTAETSTMIPIIRQYQARQSLSDMAVVADAGVLSASNLKDLDETGLRFIVGSRVTKAPADLASHFRWHGDAFTDGQLIDIQGVQDDSVRLVVTAETDGEVGGCPCKGWPPSVTGGSTRQRMLPAQPSPWLTVE